jgi:hypothetical protein
VNHAEALAAPSNLDPREVERNIIAQRVLGPPARMTGRGGVRHCATCASRQPAFGAF